MYMLPRTLYQSTLLDAIEEAGGGSMIEDLGRRLWFVFHVDFDAVTLTRPDSGAIH